MSIVYLRLDIEVDDDVMRQNIADYKEETGNSVTAIDLLIAEATSAWQYEKMIVSVKRSETETKEEVKNPEPGEHRASRA